MSRLSYKSLFLILVFLLIPIVFLLRLNQKANPAAAGWFDDKWGYRKAVSITNSVGTTLTDFQVSINIGTSALINSGKMKTDCSDLRITDTNGKLLPHWIEENNPGCNTPTDTKVWVKVPNLPSSGGTVYVYYGNSTASSTQAPNNVFDLFDDFNDNSINANKWTYTDTSPIVTSETGGVLRRGGDGPASYPVNTFTSKSYFNNYRIIESQIRINACTATEALLDLKTSVGNFTLRKYSSSPIKWQYYSSDWTDIVSSSISVGGSFVNTKLVDEATGSTIYENGSNLGTKSTAISAGTSQIKLPTRYYLSAGQTCSIDLDNVRVRKYASADPSSSLATEEVSKAPVAYWSFDEGVGTTAYDSSSNRNHGVISGATWKTEDMCISGKCLYYNGTNNNVNFGNTTKLNSIGTENFSISVWVKFNSYQNYSGIITNKIVTDNSKGIAIFGTSTGAIDAKLGNDSTNTTSVIPAGKVSTNQWHLITYTRQGNHQYFYMDGSLEDDDSTDTVYDITNTNNTLISSNSYDFTGFLDEVKIYPYVRTAAEIKSDYAAGAAHAKSDKGSSVNLGSNKNNSETFSEGLVGYWKMDENVDTTALDSSGNSNTATFGSGNSAPTWSVGKYGVGLSFGGSNHVTIADNANLRTTTQSFSFWFKSSVNPPNTFGGVISHKDSSSDGYNILQLSSGQIRAYRRISGNWKYVTSLASVTDGNWHHGVAVYDNTNIYFYIDGVLQGTDSSSSVTTFANTAYEFGTYSSSWKYSGILDEVRIYNRALSSAEVSQLYNYAPGPVAYYNFDEGVGTTAFDSSGNGNNGVWSGTGTHWDTGKYGKAGRFNGSDDYVNAGSATSLDLVNEITLEAWVKFDSMPPTEKKEIVGKGSFLVTDLYSLHTGDSGGNKLWFSAGGNWYQGASWPLTNLKANTWYHIVGVATTTTQSLYVDGILRGGPTNRGSMSLNVYPLTIGRASYYDGFYFPGQIDEVKIYNYALTQKQIVSDMNAGHPNVGSPIASALAHYKFDEGYGTVTQNWGNAGVGLSGVFGTGNSAPTWTQNGKFGKALSFDGNDKVTVADSDIPDIVGDMSLSAWVYPTTTNGWEGLISKWGNSWAWALDTTSHRNALHINGWLYSNSNTPINQWSYLAVVYKDSEDKVYFYLNGKPDGSSTQTVNQGLVGPLTVGYWSNLYFLEGLIDEPKVYNYALTADEIKTDYNQGKSLIMGGLSSGAGNTAPATAGSQEYCVPGDTATCLPPVARWDFNEGVGTTAYDTSGNGNNATFQGTPVWTNGKIGKALNFNDSADYLTTSGVAIGTTWTISAWANFPLPNNGSYRTLVRQGASHHHILVHNNGTLGTYVTTWYSSGFDTNTLSGWHQITAIGVGNTTQFYIDGQFKGNANAQETGNITQIGGIGSQNWGITDQIKIYNYARSPAQIAWDYNRGEPIAHYKMDECQGAVINDWSGNGLHGTLSIGASGTQTSAGTCQTANTAWGVGATGKINSSINFDGSDDYIETGSLSATNYTDLSYSYWLKTPSADGIPISWADYRFCRIGGVTANKINCSVDGSSSGSVTSRTSVNDNLWHHVVVTSTANSQIIYIDGKSEGTASEALNTANSGVVDIGKNLANTIYFNGQIDDVQIFNFALTSTQVKTLYSGGAVNFR